jgi:PAS domain S-box-containing protein
MWSPGQRRLFGVDEDQTITYERYQAMIAPADSERVAATVAAALESADTYEVDHGIVRSDGTEIFVNSRALITRASDGEATRIFGVTMDITSRVQAERELRRAVEAEREVAARLREVDELKTSILSAVSHELRTPLTSVHGLGVVLQDQIEQLEPARRREIVDHIVTESERLGSLLSDLLDLDRLRRGVIVPQRTSVDVGRLIRGVVETRDRPEQFELQLDDFTFELDGPKFERIVENLVMNAEKYAGHGAHVVVRTTLVGDELQLCVEDDGPGVPDQLHESIFEAFNRGDAELGFAPGTGIGLSLVKRFAQLHGGTARVEAGARGGAAFIVSIPQRGAFDEPNIIAG